MGRGLIDRQGLLIPALGFRFCARYNGKPLKDLNSVAEIINM